MKVAIVTGAAGFLGRDIVDQLLNRNIEVKAIVRPGRSRDKLSWKAHSLVEFIEIDLSLDTTFNILTEMLSFLDKDSTVLIHTVATYSNNDDVHLKQTIEPTRQLFKAMAKSGTHRIVLVSSLSVYGYSSLPDYAQLDETSSSETYINFRDGYCRAKMEQEKIAILAAQVDGATVTIVRPGMIYSADNLWSTRLGFTKGSIGINIGNLAPLPLVSVEDCANAIILAAIRANFISDIYIPKDTTNRHIGALEYINIIGDEQPTQKEFLALLRVHNNFKRKNIVTIPWWLVKNISKLLFLVGILDKKIIATLPVIMIEPALHARFKPLKYSNCRLKDRLNWKPTIDLISILKNSNKGS
jgi:nucleoside-diphosphate-sugar epimerase